MSKYGDAEGYDRYMGGWSAALSPPFLAFAGGTFTDVLDVGCGTGNLLAAAKAANPKAALAGVDPSAALLTRARARPELAGVSLVEGGVEALPFPDGRFTHTLSMLVLQEFADRDGALGEMRRVTRPGGIVAACQWDFAKMPVIAALVEAIVAVDPEAGAKLVWNASQVFETEGELTDCWTRAGLLGVEAGRIRVTRSFADFDALWQPLLAGSTPSTLTLAGLPEEARARVHQMMRVRLGAGGREAEGEVTAEALVVRGRR